MDQESKLNLIQYGPVVCASLSAIGSSLTILTIYRTRISGVALTTYHRLILGICLFDLVFSLALALGPLPAPAQLQAYGFKGAHGNLQTCAAQGFFFLVGNASFAYTTMLMWYYVLVVVCNMRAPGLLRIEPILHAIPILFYTIAAFVGLGKQMINFSGAFCFIGTYPLGCLKNPKVECIRGENVRVYSFWVGTLPIIVWNLMSALALLILGISVCVQYGKSRQWEDQRSTKQPRQLASSASPTIESSSSFRILTRRVSFGFRSTTLEGPSLRTGGSSSFTQRQVLVQCSLYALQFLNVATWISIVSIQELIGNSFDAFGSDFWLFAMALLMFPLQGFFLFLIFIRPRYANARQTYRPEATWWECFCGAVWDPMGSDPNNRARGGSPHRHRAAPVNSPDCGHQQHETAEFAASNEQANKEKGVDLELPEVKEEEEEEDAVT